ncbi:MAG TPA: CaiB/BaiF CoA-transferase family protein [Candidatus Binatia bacterium]|nr:CaiB/BaiF CoA-transferase family protein [Candidatus Binatia bacterium]
MASASPLLERFTVLDLSSVGPASRASRILADYGANVIKVGPTSGKGSVQIQPPFHTYGAGRGMRRVQIDLKAPAGKAAFLRLAAAADVVIESYRPGVADRLGIGYEDVKRINERIVYCSTSGYGRTGPRAKWAGHDINYLAVAGYLACSEPRADGGPPIPGATVADSAGGGMHAVIAILAALLSRQTTGTGQHLDVSVAEGVLSLMSLSIDQYLATGEAAEPGKTLLTGRYACYDLYRARDGKWLSVGAIEPQFYGKLCKALGLEQYAALQTDDSKQEEIRAAFRNAFVERDRDEWVELLAPNDTCVAPVSSIAELVEDEQFVGRGVFMRAEHPEHGEFRQVAPLLAGGERNQSAFRAQPFSVTDTDELLRGVRMSDEEIEKLKSEGVIE